jgi:prolyl-tRNA synthetase
MHATKEEAIAETEQMLNIYADFAENSLAIPVVKGRKTESEKFAGAEATYTIEALMHDGKALQSGTSHFFGDGFARAFDITFSDKDNKQQYPFQTSWGVSTRIIGAIIMTHGDDNGLVLPPAVAPIQVVVIPVAQHKEGVLDKAYELLNTLKSAGIRAKIDDSDNSTGWKFAEYEMKGVPLRLEIGPRDMEQDQCVIVRRDNREKTIVPLAELTTAVPKLLNDLHEGLYKTAKERTERMTYDAHDMEELKDIAANKPGFIRAMWCGDPECEKKLKDEAGVSSRCMPFDGEPIGDTCVCCGKKAKALTYWGKAY